MNYQEWLNKNFPNLKPEEYEPEYYQEECYWYCFAPQKWIEKQNRNKNPKIGEYIAMHGPNMEKNKGE